MNSVAMDLLVKIPKYLYTDRQMVETFTCGFHGQKDVGQQGKDSKETKDGLQGEKIPQQTIETNPW